MQNIQINNEPIIIRKHWIVVLEMVLYFILLIIFSSLLLYFTVEFKNSLSKDFVVILSIISVIIYNFALIKLILHLVDYSNDLVVFHKNIMMLLKSTLIAQDDIEIIQIQSINKFKKESHWIIQNILKYWDILIVQQNDDIRILKNMPKPHNIIRYFELHKEYKGS